MQLSRDEIQTLLGILRDFDPNKLTQEVVREGEHWADQDAAASHLEETRKSLLAKITLEFIEGGMRSGAPGEKPKPMPASQAELRAVCDERYEQHLNLMVSARQEANRARVRYDLGKLRLELMRSLQATMRQEMRMGGSVT